MRCVARLTIVLALLLAACSPARYSIRENYDEFNKIKNISMHKNYISGWQFHWMALNAAKLEKEGVVAYVLVLQYLGKEWAFIEPGESLVLLVDGERIGLTSQDGSLRTREVDSYANISETATYMASAEVLRKLAYAKSAKVRIVGKYARDYTMEQNNIEHFRQFYETYVARN